MERKFTNKLISVLINGFFDGDDGEKRWTARENASSTILLDCWLPMRSVRLRVVIEVTCCSANIVT